MRTPGSNGAETLRNLREIAPTIYFNVPKGWEELAIALEQRAAGQAEPVGLAQKISQRRVADIFQQRKTRQAFPQFFGIERLRPDAERRKERHAHVSITMPSNHHLPSGMNP